MWTSPFWDKGPDQEHPPKIQHSKLADRDEVETKRTFWRATLARLAGQLSP